MVEEAKMPEVIRPPAHFRQTLFSDYGLDGATLLACFCRQGIHYLKSGGLKLFFILMGFGNLPIIIVVALSAFFPAALSVMNATESVQQVHVSAARVSDAVWPTRAKLPT